MKCRDCKWMYTNETMGSLYICVNGRSENFGEYTGLLNEDECEDGEGDFNEDDWRFDRGEEYE